MRRLIGFLFFLVCVNEGDLSLTIYAQNKKMFAPFSWGDNVVYDPLGIKLRIVDAILIACMLAAGAKGAKGRVRPMRSMMMMGIATTIVWFILGTLRHGDSRAAGWQIYLMIAGPVAAFAVAATHTKVEHFRDLAKFIVAAGIYRALMCVIFYFAFVRGTDDVPPVMTTHTDTVLWVVTLSMIWVNFLERPKERAAKMLTFLGSPLVLAAIQFNNRRLAWVSLLGSVLALFFLLRPSPAKRRLKRIGKMMVPVLAVYVAVGWGRQEKIFKPLASLSSVSSKPDASTLARNVENLSLIATNRFSPITGTGFGHKYVELSDKYTIEASGMELWPYVPHNSILGLFAYTGFLGVMGYWMMFVTAVFFHARTARLATEPRFRSAGLVGVMMTVAVTNQMFGDMGIFQSMNLFMMAISWAAALRIPMEAGVWPGLPKPAMAAAPVTAAPSVSASGGA